MLPSPGDKGTQRAQEALPVKADSGKELESALEDSNKASESPGVATCPFTKADDKPTNVVTPVLTPVMDGWYHSSTYEKGLPAIFTVGITEAEGSPPYSGGGTLTVPPEIEGIYLDSGCNTACPIKLPLSDLKSNTRVYARFNREGGALVTLTLDPSNNPLIDVRGPADALLRAKPVNVVEPLVGEPSNGWVNPRESERSKTASVEFGLRQSQSEPPYAGPATISVEGGSAENLFLDPDFSKPLPPKILPKDFPLKLFFKPVKPLKLKLKLTLDDPHDARMLVMVPVSVGLELQPVNLVVPKVGVEREEAWFDPEVGGEYDRPASVKVSLTESVGSPAYTGEGSVTAGTGVTLYRDEAPLIGPIPASELKTGVTLTVKGTAAGQPDIELSLTPSDNPLILVIPSDKKSVTVKKVNVLTPKAATVASTGWFGDLLSKPHPASFTAALEHLDEARVYSGNVVITADNGAALFEDEGCKIRLPEPIPASRLIKGLPVFAKGGAPGEVRLIVTPAAPEDKTFRLARKTADATVKMEPINVVSPHVEIVEKTGWYQAEKSIFLAARVRVKIAETNTSLPYGGTGTVSAGTATLFFDEGFAEPAAKLSAGQLRNEGTVLYVKGTSTATPSVKLELGDSGDLRIVPSPASASAVVEFKPINVVTPKITMPQGKAILVNKKIKDKQTGLEAKVTASERTMIEISLTESPGAPAYDKTGKLAVPGHIKVYTAATDGALFDLDKALSAGGLKTPKKLYLEGDSAGSAEITLTLVKSDLPGIHTILEAKETMVAVSLEMEVYKINRTDPWAEAALSDTEKIAAGRVLHVQDAAKYSRAKIVVKKPAGDLWTIGGDGYNLKIELSNTSGNGILCAADSGGGGSASVEITKSDFATGDKTLWLEGTAAVTAIRGVRAHLGLSGTAVKKYGDWAAFTVVKINTVSPTVANYSQEVRRPPRNVLQPATLGPRYEAEVTLTTSIAGIDIFYSVVATTGVTNAVYPKIPKEWEPENPPVPVTGPTNAQGKVKAFVTLSALKNGLHGYHGNHYQVAAYLADDPVKGKANPVRGRDIEINAPAGACTCCTLNPGHSVGCPIGATEWYEQLNFSNPAVYRPKRVDYQNQMVRVNNRAAGGCTCPSALSVSDPPPHPHVVTTDMLPRPGLCGVFFAPVTRAEKDAVDRKWKNFRDRYQRNKGINASYVSQDDRQTNHLVPRSACACPTGDGNLQPNGWLCAYCQSLDAPFSKWQDPRLER